MVNPHNSSDQIIIDWAIKPIKRIHQSTFDSFFEDGLYDNQEPMIIHGFNESDFGGCMNIWDSDFFGQVMGESDITIHSCSKTALSFSPKNFDYKRLKFKEFLDHLQAASKKNNDMNNAMSSHADSNYYYYRSVSTKPSKRAASLDELPEEIKNTFNLPKKLLFKEDSKFSTHSSILRIAQPGLEMWTHYDIPDNFLVQIRGEKRLFIFPPDQVFNLYITGSSSPIEYITSNPDTTKFPYLGEALKNALWADLNPGDVLFIPSCWPHSLSMKDLSHTYMNSKDHSHIMCVSANIFFRNWDRKDIYEGKDIYGNKDYKYGQMAITRAESSIIPELKKLPSPFTKFYLLKLASLFAREAENI